jgi:hypothetical protein
MKNTQRGQVKERVLRVLLNHPGGELTKYKLAQLAEGAFSWVHEVLKNLEKDGMIEGTKVRKHKEMFLLWKKLRKKPNHKEYMVKDILELLGKTKMKYALTTYAAENIVQKYLFPSRTDFYIDQNDLGKWHAQLSENGLVGKGNVRILMTDEHVFYKSFVKDGLTIVSTPQLIVDLLSEGAAAAEAAEMLIEKEERNVR